MISTSPIAGLFGRSPFKATQEHMKVVEACVAELLPLFAAHRRGDADEVLVQKNKVDALEHRADEVKNEIRTRLPRGLFMPVDRRDLLDLLHAQDSIADTAQDIAGFLTFKVLTVPDSFGDLLYEYVDRSYDAACQCGRIIAALDDLLELGFRGREVANVEEMVEELSRIESETDDQGMELTRRLVDEDLKPAAFFLWYEIIQKVGDVADYAEDVGDRLRLLIAR
jgi:predicted phosphate transport protein (TIGR00153 family)